MSLGWRWLGGFTVLLEWAGRRAWLDPFDLKEKAPAGDLVLVSNPRVGHSSPEDVASISGPGTRVFGPTDAIAGLPGRKAALSPGDEREVDGLSITALPAANRELSFFPRERGWLGWLLSAEGRTLLFAGATDLLPDHEGLRADVAFVPVSGRYLMGEGEARELARTTGAGVRVALFLVGDRFRPYEGFSVSDPAAAGSTRTTRPSI